MGYFDRWMESTKPDLGQMAELGQPGTILERKKINTES